MTSREPASTQGGGLRQKSVSSKSTAEAPSTDLASGGVARASVRSVGSRRLVLVVLAGCLLIWFLRRPEQLLHPYIWAEESHILRRFLDDGWIRAIGPVAGYMVFPATLLLPLAASISFGHLAVLAYWMATAVFVLTVWMLVVPESRWGNRNTRICLAFAMALCPANPETFGVLLYSFWWATLWPVIVLGWKRNLYVARIPLLIVGGLSSPAGAAMAIPFALSWWFSRRRVDAVGTGAMAVAMLVQSVVLESSERESAVSQALSPVLLIKQAFRTVGFYSAWWNLPVRVDWRFIMFAGAVLLGALALSAIYALRRERGKEPLLLFAVLALFVVLSAVPAPLLSDPQLAGPRYYFLPFVLMSWFLIYLWRESLLPSPIPMMAGVIVAVSMLGIGATFSRQPNTTTAHLDWHQEIVDCAASSTDLVEIPIYVDGSVESLWSLKMTPGQCRAGVE